MNENELTVLRVLRSAGGPLPIADIAKAAFPKDPNCYTTTTNALRWIPENMIRKVSRGTYEAVKEEPADLRTVALKRIAAGEAERAVARDLKIPRSTINDWRRKGAAPVQTEARP